MSLVRQIFHWVFVVFFACLTVLGFRGRDIPFGLLNLTLAVMSLPFGPLAQLTGPRRVMKWVAAFVLLALCVIALPQG